MKVRTIPMNVTLAAVAALPAAQACLAQGVGDPDLVWVSGGHRGSIVQFEASPDGSVFATASTDGTVKLWTPQGDLVRTIGATIGEEFTTSLSFTADSQHLVIATPWTPGLFDPTLKLWRVSDGEVVRTYNTGTQTVFSANISADGQEIVAGAGFEQIKTWRLSDATLLSTIATGFNSLRSVALSPDQTLVAASGNFFTGLESVIQVYNHQTGALITTLTGPDFLSTSVRFSPDGTLLAAGDWGGIGNNGKIFIWRVSDWQLIHTLHAPFQTSVYHVEFSPSGQLIAGGLSAGFGTVRVWNVASGAHVTDVGDFFHGVSMLAFRDEQTIAAAGYTGITQLHDIASQQLIQEIGVLRGTIGGPFDTTQGALAFSPDSTMLVSGGSPGDTAFGKIEFFDSDTGTILGTGLGHVDYVTAVAWSADGTRVASGSGSPPPSTGDPTLRYWSAPNGALLWTSSGHFGGTTAVVVSPDGQRVISGGRDNLIKVWNAANGALLQTVTGHSDPLITGYGYITCLAITPDNQHLLSASVDHTIRVWSLPSFTFVDSFSFDWYPRSMSFTPDGETLAITTSEVPNNPKLLSFPAGVTVQVCDGDLTQGMWAGTFLPGGQYLMTSNRSYPPRVWFWDPFKGDLVLSYDRQVGWRYSPAVGASADGRYIAIGRYDATVEVARNPFAPPPLPQEDLNHDGHVNGLDLALLLGAWGPCSGCPADLNGDSVVNGLDLAILLGAWD